MLLRRLSHDRKAVVTQPIRERPDTAVPLILKDRVIICSDKGTAFGELGQQALRIDIEAESLGREVQVHAIDEQGGLLKSRHTIPDEVSFLILLGPSRSH